MQKKVQQGQQKEVNGNVKTGKVRNKMKSVN